MTTEHATLAGEVQVSGDGASFVRALIAADCLPLSEVDYFLGRPEKWQDEYAAWIRFGKPSDASEPGWSEFVAVLEQ